MTACRKNLSMGLTRQIPFRRTFEVKCMDLVINQYDVQPGGSIVPLARTIEGMANLSPPDLVRFRR